MLTRARSLALVVVAALFGTILVAASPAAAATIAGLPGTGSAADPFVIDSAEDLDAAAQSVNAEPGAYGSLHYRLDADIDYRGRTFTPFAAFAGTFDGNGHAVSNLAMSATDARVGFFVSVNGGTVKNLTLRSVQVTHTSELETPGRLYGAILVETAHNAVIEGNSLIDSSFTALSEATNSYAAGLVRGATGTTVVRNNYLNGVTVNAPTKYVGAVAFVATGTASILNNLVLNTRVTQGAQGAAGQAALIVTTCTTSTVTVAGNAVHSGWLYQNASNNTYYYGWITAQGQNCRHSDNLTNSNNNRNFNAEGHVEQPVRTRGTGSYDLAWDSDFELISSPLLTWNHGVDGTPTTRAQLETQSTYEGIGWNFAAGSGEWRWEPAMQHPVPARASIAPFMRAGIPGAGTIASPYQIDSPEDLEAMRAAISSNFDAYGSANYRLTGDIDLAGAEFTGFDAFAGVIDGNGHVVSDLVYAPSDTSDDLAFIRELGGVVRGLTLADVALAPTAGTERVAGVAIRAEGTPAKPATVTRTQLRGAALVAPGAKRGAGLVAESAGRSVVSDNDVDVEIAVTDLAAGAVGRAAGETAVRNNLIRSASLQGAKRDDVVGERSGSDTAVTGNVVVGADDDLDEHQKASYTGLGWDFVDAWMWDPVAQLPRIKYVAPEEKPNRITATFHGDPETRRAFTWYQNVDMVEPGAIVSTDPSFPEDATATVTATAEVSNEGEAFYRAIATGLTPGLTYHYRVGDAFTGKWSETGAFETADGGDDFTFINVTDTQARGGASEAVVSANTISEALKTAPDAEFIVHGGDVVQTSEEENDWIELFGYAQESLLATTIAPVSGNHDAGKDEFTQHFTLDAAGEQDTSTGVYYSYDYNDAHFVMLNTNEGRDGHNAHDMSDLDYEPISDEQLEWIAADVAQARERGAKWIILTTHKGPYTAGGHAADPDILSIRDRLVPLIDELDIDLVLQGHDHYWTRTQALRSDADSAVKAKAVDSEVITEVVGGIRVDYKVDQEGTVYVTPGTAGSKHYSQMQGIAEGDAPFSNEDYLDLFDRLGGGLRFSSNTHESFLEVAVSDGRLTVNRHEVGANDKATFAEGFGIDREVTPVQRRIGELPEASRVALSDEPAVAAARAAVKRLTKAQRAHLSNLERLRAAEDALRELRGTKSSDGSKVAWSDPGASEPQPLTVTNDQRRDLEDVPVRLVIEDTPDVSAETFSLSTSRSVPIPFEIESWAPGGASVVWAKLEELEKQSSQLVWAYFGGAGAPDNDSRDVWSNQFELVEHFAESIGAGEARVDSTGRVTGTLVGADLVSSAGSASGLAGGASARFGSSRLQYGGNIGKNNREFTLSAVMSLTPDDVAAIGSGTASLVSRKAHGDEDPTLQLGIRKADGLVETLTPYGAATSSLPKDGEPHLVTMTFDGLTYAVFLDGVEVHSAMGEGRIFPNLPGVPLTIGDAEVDPEDPNRLISPFSGVVDEIWIASNEFIPEFDAFRADNYFGDAVTPGKREKQADDGLLLTLGAPGNGASVEAGDVEVFGAVSKRAVLRATIDGEPVFSERVDSGTFAVQVPVVQTGEEIDVVFTATSTADEGLVSEPETLTLQVSDTTAPAVPLTSAEKPANRALKLQVTPQTDVPERVRAQFFANETVPLGAGNVSVRTGSTADRVPDALTPTSGAITSDLTPETVGEDENPYQIYRIALTEEQAAEDEWHFSWRGTADTRTVSAWVWNTETGSWALKESDASAEGETVNLDVRATTADRPVDDSRTLTVLVWRGLTEEPWAQGVDFDNRVPSADDYDWSFNHVGDTQLYTEATPWTMTEQFEYIRDHAEAKKTAMVVQAGDWVNREEYEDEWQWKSAEPSAKILEQAGIPFAISWGNHDYNKRYNGRQLLPKYFPMKRFENSLEGSPWTFGGSHDIDSYYYTGEIAGAKILWLQLGFWSAESEGEPGTAWAKQVIESHPEYTVILSTHHHLWARDVNAPYSNPLINPNLVDPYPNVKLVLSGHQSGTFVSSRLNDHGVRTYGILTDYQTRAWGGHGYLKNLSVDAENGLIHVNTYSPWLQRTTSEGRWSQPIPLTADEGYHGENSENYVIELDLGGHQARTLDTSRVTFASGEPQKLGEPIDLVGDERGEVEFEPELDVDQEWYAVVTDEAGHSTASKTSVIRRVASHTIDYDLAGGTLEGASNPEAYSTEDAAIALTNPKRTGYTFVGWTGTGLSSPSTDVTIPTGSAGDRSYTANWEPTEYAVEIDLAGGYLTSANPRRYTIESEAIALSNPRRTGYTFAGWTGTGLDGPTTSVEIPAGSTGERSYVAEWTPVGFPITYRLGGGKASGNPSSYTVTSEDFTLANPTRAGYTFIGWTGTGLNKRTTAVTVSKGTRGALIFTANWSRVAKAKPAVSVKVTTKGKKKPSRAIVTVRTARGYASPTGRVTITAKGKVTKRVKGKKRTVTVTRTRSASLKAGKATVKLPKTLSNGKRWRVTAKYAGNAEYQAGSSRAVEVQARK